MMGAQHLALHHGAASHGTASMVRIGIMRADGTRAVRVCRVLGSRCGDQLLRRRRCAGSHALRLPSRALLPLLQVGLGTPLLKRRHWLLRRLPRRMQFANNIHAAVRHPRHLNAMQEPRQCTPRQHIICCPGPC